MSLIARAEITALLGIIADLAEKTAGVEGLSVIEHYEQQRLAELDSALRDFERESPAMAAILLQRIDQLRREGSLDDTGK